MTDMTPPGAGGQQLYLQALQDIARALGGIYNPLNTLLTSSPWTVPFGGTGRTTLTAHAVLLGEGASQIAFATPAGAGRLLIDQGAAADPAFTAVSGDITITSGGAVTIANDAVTTVKILNANVTYAKIQNISATQRVLGRNTAGAGVTEEVTFTQFLDWVGSAANGDILYRTGGAWARLPIGSNTNVLTVASNLPSWAAPSGGGITPTVDIRTGSATITIPTGATKLKVTLVGGGGGGGGCAVGGACAASVGGSGGPAGSLVKYLSGLTAGNTLALTIGSAGSAGTAGNNAGGNGGDSTLASGTQTITTLTASKGNGGGGAASGTTGTTGTSGTGTNGDANLTGGSSFTDATTSYAGSVGLGFGQATIRHNLISGAGPAGLGFGAAGVGGFDPQGGVNSRAGGAGTAGIAIFEWYA